MRGNHASVIHYLSSPGPPVAPLAFPIGGGTDLTNDALVDFEDLMELADNWLEQH